MASLFSKLALSTASSTYGLVSGYAIGRLNKALDMAAGGQSTNVHFYCYRDDRSFVRVLVDSALQQVGNQLKSLAVAKIKETLNSDKQKAFQQAVKTRRQVNLIKNGQNQNDTSYKNKYGCMMLVDWSGKERVVICRDYMNFPCNDGLMLKIPTSNLIKYNVFKDIVSIYNDDTDVAHDDSGSFEANYLVWYDATAMINFNSTKNVILTQVAGRDYSRKELASNGDITFSVSGHLLSGSAELLPEQKMKEFIEVMQYKGLVEINNILLDQFNIEKILIKDFSITPVEGNKSQLNYTFNAVGIQPTSEVEVDEDTLYIDTVINNTTENTDSEWITWLKDKAKGAGNTVIDSASTAASIGINLL